MLLVLISNLTAMTNGARMRLAYVVFLFKPETLLKWHRELVRRTWTFKQGALRGRPTMSPDLEGLILRLAKENPTWGYGKLEDQLGEAWGAVAVAWATGISPPLGWSDRAARHLGWRVA